MYRSIACALLYFSECLCVSLHDTFHMCVCVCVRVCVFA